MPRLARFFTTQLNEQGHRVTTLELFFDLVYVFAFTQVTAWIAREHSVVGTAQGLLMLAIMWWTWVAYSWMSNVMRADRGAALLGFVTSATAIFVVALTIRHVWEAEPGELAPVAFAVGYVVIRVVHAAVYAWGSRGQALLLKQIGMTALSWIPTALLLLVGAQLAPGERIWLWAGALAADLAATWILARVLKGWQIRSAVHFAERFGLIVILALGESVVAVGVAAEHIELTGTLIFTAVLGTLAAMAFWWVYFRDVGPAVEHAMVSASGPRQVELGRDAYTYLHLPLVAGIIVAAAGVEEAVFALADHEVAGLAATLIAAGSALVCASGAALMALVRGPWLWLTLAAAFFVAGAFWMRAWDPMVALGATALVMWVVGLATPKARAHA